MKFNISRKQKAAIAGIVIGFIIAGQSCLKRQDLSVEDLGSALAAEDIAQALGDAFGPINYSDMRVNEMTDIIYSQRIQDGVPQNLEQQEITIKEIDDQPSYLRIKSRMSMTSYYGGSSSTDVRDWDQYFQKYNGFAFSNNSQQPGDLNPPLFTFQLIQNIALGSCYDGGSYPETCHNLTVQEVDYRVPPPSAYQHNCADFYNCFIKAKKIEFDLLQKYNLDDSGRPNRVHYTIVMSQEVPFTSRVLEFCTRSTYALDGVPQKVLADLCYKVNKYTFAQ